MGMQRAVPEGDAAGADDLADVGGEGVQSFQVAVDPAPQESLVEVAAAAQAQVQGGARGRRGGQGRAQRGDRRGGQFTEEGQGDVPVLDPVPPQSREGLVGGAQGPGQFVLGVVGRGEGHEDAQGRGLGVIVHEGEVSPGRSGPAHRCPGRGCRSGGARWTAAWVGRCRAPAGTLSSAHRTAGDRTWPGGRGRHLCRPGSDRVATGSDRGIPHGPERPEPAHQGGTVLLNGLFP